MKIIYELSWLWETLGIALIAAAVTALGCDTNGEAVSRVASACNADAAVFVAVQLDFLKIQIQYPVQKRVGRFCVIPSVFLRAGHKQAVCFCCLLEQLIVIRSAPAAILSVQNGVVVLVTHFMQQRCRYLFNASVQRSCADIDFFPSFALHIPSVEQGIVPIRAWGALYRYDGHFQHGIEEGFVQQPVKLFKLSGKAACLGDFFHGIHSC